MPKFVKRPSEERGFGDLGWGKSDFSFSFSSYYDPDFMQFGPLRVLNEDIITPANGFPTHPHREFEIFTYMIKGTMEHRDSMGFGDRVSRNSIQITSAGTGVAHSEFSVHETDDAHLLQIWVKPNIPRLEPSYAKMEYSEEDRINKLLPLISQGNRTSTKVKNTLGIHANFTFLTCLLKSGQEVTHLPINQEQGEIKYYIHSINSTQKANLVLNKELELKNGDGAFVSDATSSDKLTFANNGTHDIEFVVMEMSQ